MPEHFRIAIKNRQQPPKSSVQKGVLFYRTPPVAASEGGNQLNVPRRALP